MISLGERLKKARKNAGYSRVEAAGEIGTSYSYIARLECDEVCPTINRIVDIARLYGVSVAYLVGEAEEGGVKHGE